MRRPRTLREYAARQRRETARLRRRLAAGEVPASGTDSAGEANPPKRDRPAWWVPRIWLELT